MTPSSSPFAAAKSSLAARWDGNPRLDTWMIRTLGAPDTAYVRAVSRLFIMGMAARAMEPGCKADFMLILMGHQGCGKSSALRTLCGDALYADIAFLSSRDAVRVMSSAWIAEVSEFERCLRTPESLTELKGFITQSEDWYRPAYGSEVKRVPRTAVLAGTTAEDVQHLAGRRFWVVQVGKANVDAITSIRLQLIAEAATRLLNGRSHQPDTEEAACLATASENAGSAA